MTPLEIAQQRIDECRRTRSTTLDLSELGLETIPEAVFELTWLEKLDVLGLGLGKIREIPLAIRQLTALTAFDCSGNQIRDLSPLSHLLNLQSLDCSSNPITDLAPISQLLNLQSLSCRNNQISDLSPISHLLNLQSLSCRNNQISDLSPIQNMVLSEQLETLYLYGNPICGMPAALLGSDEYETCEENLRNYWLDLAQGAEKQRQLKLQLVGNGRVGKTTLAYALEHKRAPHEPFASTHGIVIKEIQQTVEGEDAPVTLQLWDFGGQEIYHATHRLFLADDCLYLLLWAEATEEHPDETRHPVSYWLELIHDLAPNSPVILVKNQIDRADRLPERPLELHEDLPGVSQIHTAVKVSAMQYRGMPTLRGAIESVLEELRHRVCLELPSSWLAVQRALIPLREQKTIPFAHFQQLCIKAGVNHAEWFADYLHKTGVLFYRRGAFQDQIILDQNWAINAVYRVFDPKGYRSFIEQMRGRFKGEFTRIFWAEVQDTEREIYLAFMRNCGICYEPYYLKSKPFAEREFIIPALLPPSSTAEAVWGTHPNDWQLDIEYPFLHRSIIERVILHLGETYNGEPWRTGIFCQTDAGQLLLTCVYADKQQSAQGCLRFRLRGEQLAPLVYALRKLIQEVSPHRRYREFLSKAGADREPLPELEDDDTHNTQRLEDTHSADKPINIFISYSKEDESYLKPLKTRLDNIKRSFSLNYWSDHHLQAGGKVHQDILRALETADIVLLIVSPDFIATDYCFDIEVQKALQLYEQGKNTVIPIIIRETLDWVNYNIGQLTALPTKGKPLEDWQSADKFWTNVQQGIRERVAELSAKRR